MRLSFDDGGERVTAMPDAGVGAEAVAEAYQHFALPMVLQALGHEVLHASAVCSPRGVTAFCGDSGAGKSTIAHGLHRRGHAAWADDAVALDISPAAIDAVPLPFDARLRPASAELFGLGAAAIRLPVAAPPAPLPLLAVCVLTRLDAASGPPALERLAPAAAFAALLPHAFCFSLRDVARKRLMLERYLSLIARVPVFRLAFGTALDGVPAILDRLEPMIGAAGR
jgi:hypothetical protein